MKIVTISRNEDNRGFWFVMTDEHQNEWTSWRMSRRDTDQCEAELRAENPDARWVRGIYQPT